MKMNLPDVDEICGNVDFDDSSEELLTSHGDRGRHIEQ